MIIDADVHISPFKDGNRISYDELLLRMDRSGVEKAVTWLQPTYFRDVELGNQYVFEAMSKHPDRILGFGWVDPHFGLDACLKEIQRFVEEYGFYGVKLNGAQNYFSIDDELISLPLIEAIVKTDRLLAFHIGADSIEFTHPFRLAKIARRFPQAMIIAVHMGGAANPDLSRAMIEVAKECKNIYLVGSEIRPPAVLNAIETLGPDRVLFGSDTPFELMHVEVAKYSALLENFNYKDRNLVMSGNAFRLFTGKRSHNR